MIFNPVIPIPIMAAICVVLILLKRRGIVTFIRQILVVMLLFTINLRPSIPTEEAPVINENVDILLVVDNTISMLAKDYDGHNKRLDGVRDDIAKIISEFPTARIAMITFNNKAEYTVPYTYQNDLIIKSAKVLNGQNKMAARGTNLNLAYDTMEEVLSRKGAYDDEEEERIQLVFFFSDGENTDDEELDSFEDLSDYIDAGAVFGYGSEEGTNMYVVTDYYWGDEELLEYYDEEDYGLKTAKTVIDEDNLESLAEDLGIEYCYVEEEGDSYDLIEEIRDNVESGYYMDDTEDGFYELYWIFAAGLALLLFIDFIQYRIKLGKER